MKYLLLFFPLFFLSQKTTWNTYLTLATKNIENHDLSSATKNLDKALALSPHNPTIYFYKGFIELIQNDKDNGCRYLVESIYYGSEQAQEAYMKSCLRYNPKLNLSNFKEGNFKISSLAEGGPEYRALRKDGMEYDFWQGESYSGTIKWLGDGDYTIIPDQSTTSKMPAAYEFITRALKIDGDQYLYIKIEQYDVGFGIVKKVPKSSEPSI